MASARGCVCRSTHTHQRVASCASLIVGSMSYPVRGSTLEGMQRCAPGGARSAVSLIDQRTSGVTRRAEGVMTLKQVCSRCRKRQMRSKT